VEQSGDHLSFEDLKKFRDLMCRVREGSEEAVWEVCHVYGGHLRRAVRRVLDPKLRSKFDSLDFAQCVWFSFFRVPEKAGRFETPQQLVKFLAAMAHNKVRMEIRQRLATGKHDVRREVRFRESLGEENPGVTAPEPEAVDVAIAREQWERMLQDQPPHYRRIIQLKLQGYSCAEIGTILDLDEETVRRFLKKLLRATVE
jgi:RNA polymerase sigma-70 factor (ECF subfamily)